MTLPDGVPATVVVERPKVREHGDYATNVALQLGKKAGMAPRELAGLLAEELSSADGIGAVDIAGPGFLNITVEAGAQGAVAADVVAAGASYGSNDVFAGEKINLEFVSANPTGPLHIGGTRWAAVGDALGRVFDALRRRGHPGVLLQRPRRPDRPVLPLAAGQRARPGRARGRLRRRLHRRDRRRASSAAPRRPRPARRRGPGDLPQVGVDLMFDEIKATLHDFGVDFDVYFHEDSLHESGAVQKAIDRLTEMGNTYEHDGALWLRTEKYGDDKDRVIVRSNGEPAYLSGDLAYYLDKRERGFDRCLIMLGADHHGYVGRMMAMCAAFGDTRTRTSRS